MKLTRRHPFTGRRELNTRAARERDGWIEEARRYASNESFWRERTEQRCAVDGHRYVTTDDGSGLYCTCCGDTRSFAPTPQQAA